MRLKLFLLMLLASTLAMTAQTSALTGVVVNGTSGAPVGGATVELKGSKTAVSGFNGDFSLEGLKDGPAYLLITCDGFQPVGLDVQVHGGKLNLGNVSLTPAIDNEVDAYFGGSDDLMFDEAALDDEEGTSQGVSSLTGSNDNIYYSTASYNFGPMYFNYRGYDSQYQSVYINGIRFNDIIRGRFNFNSLLGMSSRAFRNRTNTVGLAASNYGFGDIGGSVNYNTTTDLYAPGFNGSVAFTNSNYMLRAMATYASGMNKHGWAYTVSAIGRYSKEGVQPGTFYNSGGLFLSVEKMFNENNSLTLTAFGGPTQRATGGATYKEVYELTDDNLYNPFWGWQDGKKRSSRITETFDPTVILNYLWKNGKTSVNTAAAVRWVHYTRSALQYFKANDPNPTYYRYLPSYYYDDDDQPTEQSDYYTWLWKNDDSFRQINWDNLYNINRLNNIQNESLPESAQKGSSYILENRTNNQFNAMFNSYLNTAIDDVVALQAGVDFNYTRSSNYKTIRDLLGGEFWTDIDPFSDRDITLAPELLQNDLDNPNRKVYEGDKFGYNYEIHAIKANAWIQNMINLAHWDINYGVDMSYTQFYRYGHMRNGRSPQNSLGRGATHRFDNAVAKVGATYKIDGRNYIMAHAEYGTHAPLIESVYISPRIKDDIIADPKSERILSADLSYSWNYRRFRGTITGYWTEFYDAVERTAFYDDNYSAFTNYVLSGVRRCNKGVEIGMAFKITPSITLTAAGTVASYRYKNNPEGTRSFENGLNPDTTQVIYIKNYRIGGTPQTAFNVGVDYAAPKNWYFNVNASWMRESYVKLAPAYHEALPELWQSYPTEPALQAKLAEISAQGRMNNAFVLNASVGKVIYINRKVSLNINLNVDNITNNRNIMNNAYQQGRIDRKDWNMNKYPNRYSYAQGIKAFLNIGVRF